MARLAHGIVLSWGWRRALIAFAAGALSVLATCADRRLAGAVLHLSGPGVAGRRRGRRPARRRAERRDRRLVVRLRLFPRRPLLGRLRLPGRRQDLRLAAAVRGRRRCRPAWPATRRSASRWRASLWVRGPLRILALAVALTACRMAARPSAHRISLERVRLRADRTAGAGAVRVADRHLGPDVSRGRGVCSAGHARRRPHRHATAVAAACHGRRAARSCSPATARCGLRTRRRSSSTACGCGSCSPMCSRTRNSIRPPSRR